MDDNAPQSAPPNTPPDTSPGALRPAANAVFSEPGGPAFPEPGVPTINGINTLGVRTLYVKEVQRFFKVQLQTIWAPAATTLLFLAIFTLALGRARANILGLPYVQFLAPGLIIMGMAQNAFQNSLSTLLISKVQGTIIDVLMPPLSSAELLFAYVAGSVTRAWAVGLAIWGAMLLWPGVTVTIHDPVLVLFFGTMGAILLALIGVLTGVWADKFDHGAAVTNFLIQPLTLLSGTFYLVGDLPGRVETISRFNPFFYMIDGFRTGFIATGEAAPLLGAAVVVGLALALAALTYALLEAGWKLRA